MLPARSAAAFLRLGCWCGTSWVRAGLVPHRVTRAGLARIHQGSPPSASCSRLPCRSPLRADPACSVPVETCPARSLSNIPHATAPSTTTITNTRPLKRHQLCRQLYPGITEPSWIRGRVSQLRRKLDGCRTWNPACQRNVRDPDLAASCVHFLFELSPAKTSRALIAAGHSFDTGQGASPVSRRRAGCRRRTKPVR